MKRWSSLIIMGGFMLLVGLRSPGNAKELHLVRDGKPNVCIVLAEDADPTEKLAAQELVEHLELMTGLKVPVDTAPVAGLKPLWLGEAGRRENGTTSQLAGKAGDSFLLLVEDDGVQIRGGSSDGTLVGAYELLEQLGVRWFFPGPEGTIVPPDKNPGLKHQQTLQVPSFASRQLQGGVGMSKKAWKTWLRRNRCGTPSFPGAHGLRLPKGITVESHPQLFALVGGKRDGRQVCVSNPELVRVVTESTRAYFRDHPGESWIGLGPSDGDGFCECEGCVALDGGDIDPYLRQVSHTDRYVWLYNQILKGLEDEFPHHKIGFYAYHSYMRPPVKVKPSPRIVPALAPINLCRIHGPGNPICAEQVEYVALLRAWKALVPVVYDRGYWSNLADPGLMFPMFDKIGRQISVNHREGIQGMRIECFGHWASEGPSLYLGAKLMWNVDDDVDRLLKDYFNTFYGPAGPAMEAAYRTLDQALSGGDFHTGGSWDTPHLFTPLVRAEARAHFAQAVRLANTETFRQRVSWAERAFARTEAFITMVEARAGHDYASSATALDQVREIQAFLVKQSPPMINARHTPAYLERFYSKATEEGAQRVAAPHRLLAGFNDVWLFRESTAGDIVSDVLTESADTGWRPLRTSSLSWGSQGLRYFRGEAWYRQAVVLPKLQKGRKIFLWFAGVDEAATVWMNGQLVGSSAARVFQPFEIDVTHSAIGSTKNHVLVKVTNRRTNEIGTGGLVGPVMLYEW